MNKIILVTTEGCEGCNIMRESIKQALTFTKKEGIEFEDFNRDGLLDKYPSIYAKVRFKDFPTTIFVKDNVITRKEVGTRPYIVVLRWIDIDFK